MQLLKSTTHTDIKSLSGSIFQRQAARGIILKGEDILMVYTARSMITLYLVAVLMRGKIFKQA